MRWLWLLLVVACSAPERAPNKPRDGALVAPGLRLPDDAAPIAYDLHLDLDPDKPTFSGHVAIRAKLLKATDHVWLSADRLMLGAATWSAGQAHGTLALDPLQGDEMRAFRFGQTLAAGEVTLEIAFTGSLETDQEGLFRQRADGGGWYIFSQGESVFARRFTPCFDEPRFKTPWRLTITAPTGNVVLANTAETGRRAVDDKHTEVSFAETGAMASYLVALAVGPFDVVDVGTMGRAKLPVRVAVRHGEAKNVGVVAAKLPAVVDALENYLDEPVPLAKLDLVVVPHLFGAMENPGLITFDEPMVDGDPKKQSFADAFVLVAAHELAHQWFGNAVTPAWWDDLWLSEGFASWLGAKVELQLGAVEDPELRAALTRREAIAADSGSSAAPLRRTVMRNADPDNSFDEIAYQKAHVVLSTFEDFLGQQTFQNVLRSYLKAHAGGTATTSDFVAALRSVAKNEDAANAFDQYVRATGVPIVELTKSCDGERAKVIAHARDHRIVPVCIGFEYKRYGESCALVGERTELEVGGCMPKLGNAHAAYYHHVWLNGAATGPEALPSHHERKVEIAIGDNVAAMIDRGELPAADAIKQLKTMLDASDPYVVFGGVAIARAIDELVGDDERAAWSAWLAKHAQGLHATPSRKDPSGPSEELADELDRARLELAPTSFSATNTKEAQLELDRSLSTLDISVPVVALAAPAGGDKLFARIADRAKVAPASERDDFYEALGAFGPAQAPAAVALLGDGSIEIASSWLAVKSLLERPATRTAAWRALRPTLPAVVKRMGPEQAGELVDSLGSLCSKADRDEVVTTVTPVLASIEDGSTHLTKAVAAIDQCIASRAKLGDLAGALAH